MISDEIHKSVSRMILDHCRAQYEELCSTWRDIERKAQGAVALSAALLGASFLLFRSITNPSTTITVFFLVSMVLLLASIIHALRSLVVEEVECMDDSTEIRRAGELILSQDSDEAAKAALRKFVFEHAEAWEKICGDLHTANNKKSGYLAKSQQWLFSGVVGLGISLAALLLESL